jgi:zinc transporter ZupT
VEESETK